MTLNPWRRARRSTARPMWRSGSPARAAARASRLASLVASSRRRPTWATRPTGSAGAGVGPVAVQLGGHVDVDEVAVGEQAVGRRDPVRRLVVDADARRRREADGRGRRAGAVAVEHLAPDGVELGRRHARLGGREHGVARLGHGPPGELQAGEILFLIDRHAPSVRSRGPAVPPFPGRRATWHLGANRLKAGSGRGTVSELRRVRAQIGDTELQGGGHGRRGRRYAARSADGRHVAVGSCGLSVPSAAARPAPPLPRRMNSKPTATVAPSSGASR